MSAKIQGFANDEFSQVLLSPEDALDDWPIRSMANALESPEKLKLWLRRKTGDWLERDELYEGLDIPNDAFAFADEKNLIKASKKAVREVVEGLDAASLYNDLSKYKPLAEKLPAFRREYQKATDKAWDDAKAKYPYQMIEVQDKYRNQKVPDNQENWNKVVAAFDKEQKKWIEGWSKEIEAAGMKPAALIMTQTDQLDNSIESFQDLKSIRDSLLFGHRASNLDQAVAHLAVNILDSEQTNKYVGKHYTAIRNPNGLTIVANDGRGEILKTKEDAIYSNFNHDDIRRFSSITLEPDREKIEIER